MNDSVRRVIEMRECSKVERAHTLPHHGSYTNGQHSHDAVSLYLALCPAPRLDVIVAIHSHDYGERWCGDLPAPAKWSSTVLSEESARLEARCLKYLGVGKSLDPTDLMWLKAVDALELYLWAHDQTAMGNANAFSVIGNLQSYFTRTELPQPVVEFLKNYKWTRTPDVLPK